MLKGKNNLDYEYFNRYLINCGVLIHLIELLRDFLMKIKSSPNRIDKKVILLMIGNFCREKFTVQKYKVPKEYH